MPAIPQVGVQAVIQNYDQFISGLQQMQRAVVQFGDSAQQASPPMQQMGMSADQLVTKLAGLGIVREIYGDFKDFWVQGIQTSMAMERMSIGTANLAKTIGETGDAMVQAIKDASGGTIGGLAAMQAANQATIMGVVQNKEEMADLTRIAVGLGRAMGKDAVSSLNDMTVALGRNSPRILDNLGLIVKEGVAHEEYAKSIGKTVEQLTEEERAYAFRQAALEKGRETLKNIGDTTNTAATKVEQLNAKWGELRTSLGSLALDVVGPAFEGLNNLIDRLNEGAKAWIQVIEKDLPALEAHNRATQVAADRAAVLANNQETAADAIFNSTLAIDEHQKALAEAAGTYDKYVEFLRQLDIEAGGGAAAGYLTENLRMERAEFGKIIADLRKYNYPGTMLQIAEAQRQVGESARIATEGLDRLGNETPQIAAAMQEFERTTYTLPFYLTENVSALQNWDMQWKAVYSGNYDATQKWADSVEKATRDARDAQAGYINDLISMQDRFRDSASSAGRDYADAMKDRDKSVEDAYKSHNEKLQGIAQERADKIAWVMSGAHARTKEENDKALGYWNAFYDAELNKVEQAYIQENTTINEKLRERQAAIAEAQAKERAAAEEQRKDMALQAALTIVESSGQLEALTGGAAKSASEAAALIKSGIIPLQGDLATAISNAWGTINTTMSQTADTQKTNAQDLTDLFNTTGTTADTVKTKVEEQATPLQQLTLDTLAYKDAMNDVGTSVPTSMAAAQKAFNDTLKPAGDTVEAIKKIATEGAQKIKDEPWMDVGAGIVDGIIEGIEKKRQAALDAMTGLTGALKNQAEKDLDIQSPSGVFEQYGELTGEGFIIGLQNSLQDLPSESAELLGNLFKTWLRTIRQGLHELGYDTELWHEQINAVMENLQVAPGESMGEAAERALDDLLDRLPEHLRNKFLPAMEYMRSQFGRLLQSMGSQINQYVIDPLGPLLSMGGTLTGAANTFIQQLQKRQGTAGPSTAQLAYLDALRSGSLDLLNINQQLNDERATGVGLEQQIADLQSIQGQLQVLQAEKSLVDMIREYGLSYQEILGSITLGTETSMESLIQASIRALRAIVGQANAQMMNLPEQQPIPYIAPSPAIPDWHPTHDVGGIPVTEPIMGEPPNQGYYSGGSGGAGGIYVGPPQHTGSIAAAGGVAVNFTGPVTVSSPMDLATVGSYVRQVVAEAIEQA